MTLTWTLRRDGSPPDKLLELSPDGAITWWGGRQQRYQLRVERLDETVLVHKLRIAGATPSEAGRYQCEALNEKGASTKSVWLEVYGKHPGLVH
jgi:hypothetical protein